MYACLAKGGVDGAGKWSHISHTTRKNGTGPKTDHKKQKEPGQFTGTYGNTTVRDRGLTICAGKGHIKVGAGSRGTT